MSGGLVEWLLKKPADATHHEVESEEDDDYENSIDVPKVLLAAGAVGVVGLFALWMTRNTPTPAAGAIARAPEAGGPVAAAPAVETGGRKRGREPLYGEDWRPAVKRPAIDVEAEIKVDAGPAVVHSEVKGKDEISDSDSDEFVDAESSGWVDEIESEENDAVVVESQIPEFVTFYARKLPTVMPGAEIADMRDERYHITSAKIKEMVSNFKKEYAQKNKSMCTDEKKRRNMARNILRKLASITTTLAENNNQISNEDLLAQMNVLGNEFFVDMQYEYSGEIVDSTLIDTGTTNKIPWQYLCIAAYLFYFKVLLWPAGGAYSTNIDDVFSSFPGL